MCGTYGNMIQHDTAANDTKGEITSNGWVGISKESRMKSRVLVPKQGFVVTAILGMLLLDMEMRAMLREGCWTVINDSS